MTSDPLLVGQLVGAGYRGQGARETVWVLRMAGFPDQMREGYEFSRVEHFVFDEENAAFSVRWVVGSAAGVQVAARQS